MSRPDRVDGADRVDVKSPRKATSELAAAVDRAVRALSASAAGGPLDRGEP